MIFDSQINASFIFLYFQYIPHKNLTANYYRIGSTVCELQALHICKLYKKNIARSCVWFKKYDEKFLKLVEKWPQNMFFATCLYPIEQIRYNSLA